MRLARRGGTHGRARGGASLRSRPAVHVPVVLQIDRPQVRVRVRRRGLRVRFGEARTAHVGSHAPRDDGGGGGARVPRVAERVVQGTLLRPGVLLRIFRGKHRAHRALVRVRRGGASDRTRGGRAVHRVVSDAPPRRIRRTPALAPRAARAAEPAVPTGVAAEPLVSSRHRWLPRHRAVRRRGVVTWRDTRRVRVRRARRGGAAAPGLVRGGELVGVRHALRGVTRVRRRRRVRRSRAVLRSRRGRRSASGRHGVHVHVQQRIVVAEVVLQLERHRGAAHAKPAP